MTDLVPIETTNLGPAEQTVIAWSRVRDVLTAPPPPDHPGRPLPQLPRHRPAGRPPARHRRRRPLARRRPLLPERAGHPQIAQPGGQPGLHDRHAPADGLDLVLDGEAAPIDDPAILDAVGALIQQSGWPVERTAGGFTAPFGPRDGDPPPWRLYRFVFHTAIGQGGDGATRWRFAR